MFFAGNSDTINKIYQRGRGFSENVAVVTDGKYRASISVVRALARTGYRVIVTQTREEEARLPAVARSKDCGEFRWIEGSVKDEAYGDRLAELLQSLPRPLLFCVGAGSLQMLSQRREEFSRWADFLVSSPEILENLNDKETVARRARELGLPVPRQYEGEPETYPVIVKPHCGEKFGLKAADRYAVAEDPRSLRRILARMAPYDPHPLIQERIRGQGTGASLLLDRQGRLVSAMCHRRIREYPVSGGPSTCCESFWDEELVEKAYRLLRSFGFVGMAMVEFKGDCLLEVNPRVWGSFPMTEAAGSPFVEHYARAARGETVPYEAGDYKKGQRMRFLLNDSLATPGLSAGGAGKKDPGGHPGCVCGPRGPVEARG